MQTANPENRDPKDVGKMFARVAPSYDKINRAMCFGLDARWRGVLARRIPDRQKGHARTLSEALLARRPLLSRRDPPHAQVRNFLNFPLAKFRKKDYHLSVVAEVACL